MLKRLLVSCAVLVAAAVVAIPLFGQDSSGTTLSVSTSPVLGPVLVADNGLTLYTFKRDTLGVSNCSGQCEAAWPPYIVDSADGLTVGEGIPGTVGTIQREDGTLQVTYNGWPLYFWQFDAAPGDITGHNFRTVWLVATPATVATQPVLDLGFVLVGPNGNTLYTFGNDTPGVSTCEADCAAAWPPLTVESADALLTAVNIPGSFSTVERADGTLQVAYEGMPLYSFAGDSAPGSANGQGIGNVWFAANP